MKKEFRFLVSCFALAAVCLMLFMPEAHARLHGAAAHQKPAQKPKTEAWSQFWPESIDEGLDIEETQYVFAGPLLPRSWTDAIVIHHVGVPSGEVSSGTIHMAHIGNGWLGIGYHYVIHKDGTIERGRPLLTEGAHAYGHNGHTVGINLTGNFEWEIPTDEQIESLVDLLTSLCRIFHLSASRYSIIGHEDLNSTSCPGWNLYVLLPEIRSRVSQRLGNQEAIVTEKTGNKIQESPIKRKDSLQRNRRAGR